MKIARQKFFTVFIIFGVGMVLATVFFGGNFMDHDADHPCLFSLMAGINCLLTDRLEMINHIFSGWRSLTAAIIDFKTIVLIPALLVFFLSGNDKAKLFFKRRLFFRFYGLSSVNDQKKKFSRWLALHYGLY